MLALFVGTALAVAALAYVLWPLLRVATTVPRATKPASEAAPEASAVEALREIEFDQATGKLSPEDYASLRASYTPRALAELRDAEAAAATFAGSGRASSVPIPEGEEIDPAEALIARAKALAASRDATSAKSCGSCGPRPESDALFCSDCGRYLGAACASCGANVSGDGARYCTECGASLAA